MNFFTIKYTRYMHNLSSPQNLDRNSAGHDLTKWFKRK